MCKLRFHCSFRWCAPFCSLCWPLRPLLLIGGKVSTANQDPPKEWFLSATQRAKRSTPSERAMKTELKTDVRLFVAFWLFDCMTSSVILCFIDSFTTLNIPCPSWQCAWPFFLRGRQRKWIRKSERSGWLCVPKATRTPWTKSPAKQSWQVSPGPSENPYLLRVPEYGQPWPPHLIVWHFYLPPWHARLIILQIQLVKIKGLCVQN